MLNIFFFIKIFFKYILVLEDDEATVLVVVEVAGAKVDVNIVVDEGLVTHKP